MYNDEHALDSYDMFVRFSYKCIHRSFELYPDDFHNEGFTSIKDPYNEPSISKDNDELLYFYTIYAPSKGLITSSDPLSYYRNNILDLDKHNNILVYSDDLECFILNNKTPNNGVEINFAVSLYKELCAYKHYSPYVILPTYGVLSKPNDREEFISIVNAAEVLFIALFLASKYQQLDISKIAQKYNNLFNF